MIPFARAVGAGLHRRAVMAMFAQGGKSDTLLDIIGQRMDQSPCPILYVGPTSQFLTEQWEPRIMELLDQAPSLSAKVARGKRMTKTKKIISGVPLRLAHGGSSTALKSDPAGLALTDEADELLSNVRGQGDPITLVDARGDTYQDFVHAIVSTPSRGPKDVVKDEATGLEFWAQQEGEEVESRIWSLWQEGTRYHWTWRCPQCEERFVPRFSCLEIPDIKRTTPARARAEAHLICPRNGCIIGDDQREKMNATGVYIAPGQTLDEHGNPVGDAPQSETISFWVSGLCSPFKSFGDRAAAYVAALRTGDHESIQTVINAGFGELWAPVGGDVPEWEHVRSLSLPYREGEVPDWVMFLTSGVDVQKNRLVYVVRGWGARQQSALITSGEIWGDTSQEEVWADLSNDLLARTWDGLPIRLMFVDAGYRPGKRELVPEHKVYEFARRHPRQVRATKGYDTRETPISVSRIDVTAKGSRAKVGLDLVRLSTDYTKSWVHERLRWPEGHPGGWFLHENPAEEFCKQIVSEARVRKPGGGHQWITVFRDNHYLDCEAMAFGAAHICRVHLIPEGFIRVAGGYGEAPSTRASSPAYETPARPPAASSVPPKAGPFLPRKSIW
jgi:phage terminase large subunit GpA-like protein